jgi:hypothetical protein
MSTTDKLMRITYLKRAWQSLTEAQDNLTRAWNHERDEDETLTLERLMKEVSSLVYEVSTKITQLKNETEAGETSTRLLVLAGPDK